MTTYLINLMYNRKFLVLLLIANFLGTVYGYIWYGGQLSVTPWYFYPFVPDSPTATLFLCILIVLILLNKKFGLIDALAFTTLIKYGLWAVIMNIWNFIDIGFVTPIGLMLIMSHLAMAAQAFMFLPHIQIKNWHFFVTAIWLFHNDVIDYVYVQYPRYGQLHPYMAEIGYLAFWLTVIVLILLWKLADRRNN